MSDTDLDYEIAAEVTPLYQSTALAAMSDVIAGNKEASDAWEIIDARRDELLLSEDSSKKLLSSMVMQALGGPLEATNKFAKVNNEAATYENLLEALEAKKALIGILTKSGWDEFDNFDETFCDPWDKQSANGFLASDERIKLYRIFMIRAVRKSEDGRLSDEMHGKVGEVKGLLGISDDQAEIEARAVFGPLLQKVLQKATNEIVEDYTPELVKNMQKEVNEVMENYRLSDLFLQEVGSTFYAKAVAMVNAKVSTVLYLFLQSYRFSYPSLTNSNPRFNPTGPRWHSVQGFVRGSCGVARDVSYSNCGHVPVAHGVLWKYLSQERLGGHGVNWSDPS